MLCTLCVKASQPVIRIFQDEGIALNVCDIIAKHLWLQPNENDVNANVICQSCWSALHSFHTFYLQIQEAHIQLQQLNICTQFESKLEENIKLECDKGVKDGLSTEVKLEAKEVFERQLSTYIILELEENSECTADEHSNSNEYETPLTSTRSQASSDNEDKQSSSQECQDQKSNRDDDDSDWKTNTSRAKKFRKPRKSELTKKDEKYFSKKKQSLKKCGKKHQKKKANTPEDTQINERDEFVAKNVKLSCDICLSELPTFAILMKHYRSAHNQNGYVSCCGIKFFKRCTIFDHINRHQNPEYFKCNQCGKVLSTRQNLKFHMLTHDDKQRVRSYKCELCTLSFYNKPLLKRHMHTHVRGYNAKCLQCGKFYSTELLLRRHIHSVHGSKIKNCDQCGISFLSVSALRQHKMEHTDIFQNYKKVIRKAIEQDDAIK